MNNQNPYSYAPRQQQELARPSLAAALPYIRRVYSLFGGGIGEDAGELVVLRQSGILGTSRCKGFCARACRCLTPRPLVVPEAVLGRMEGSERYGECHRGGSMSTANVEGGIMRGREDPEDESNCEGNPERCVDAVNDEPGPTAPAGQAHEGGYRSKARASRAGR